MKTKIFALILITLALAFITVTYALLYHSVMVHNIADIKTVNVEVFQDVDLTVVLTEIDWSILEPGENKTFTGYILSDSNIPIVLGMEVQNWNPINSSDYITCTWDLEDVTLGSGESRAMTFTLTIDAAISGIEHFEFDLVVGSIG